MIWMGSHRRSVVDGYMQCRMTRPILVQQVINMPTRVLGNLGRWPVLALAGAVIAAGAVVATRPSLGFTPLQTVRLAPHRAVYEMKLGDTRANSSVSGLVGRMVFEFTGSQCDGYTVNMRLVTRITDQSGKALTSDLRSSTWEEGDGDKFRFNSSQYLDQKLSELASGSALREGKGEKVDVQVEKPKHIKLKLPASVMFPAQHARAILEAAMKGRSTFDADLYEGSEKGEKVYSTTAFIGKATPPGGDGDLDKIKNADVLKALPSWPISIGYYEKEDGDGEEEAPSYELAYRYYANGVSRHLVIDYGDFSIHGSLQSLEFLDEPKCDQ